MKKYYPTYWSGCNPIHEVKDWLYVRNIIRAARKGVKIPPVIIDGPLGGGSLLTGTHRSAANDLLMMMGHEPLIRHIELSDLTDEEQAKYYELVEDQNNDNLNDYLESVEKSYV
jgi:hypothetical protein